MSPFNISLFIFRAGFDAPAYVIDLASMRLLFLTAVSGETSIDGGRNGGRPRLFCVTISELPATIIAQPFSSIQ